MSDIEVAHYQGLIGGALIWLILLTAAFFAVARKTAPTTIERAARAPWIGPVLISASVIAFFAVAPFVLYGAGASPTARGISLVVANQAGYATSFLLLGLLALALGRLIGLRGRATATFAAGTGLGIALAVFTAASNGHTWLLAPP